MGLKSMEGYGLDAYFHLPRLGNACENLPASVMQSPGQGDSMPMPPPNKSNGNGARRSFSTLAERPFTPGDDGEMMFDSRGVLITKRETILGEASSDESFETTRRRRIMDILISRA